MKHYDVSKMLNNRKRVMLKEVSYCLSLLPHSHFLILSTHFPSTHPCIRNQSHLYLFFIHMRRYMYFIIFYSLLLKIAYQNDPLLYFTFITLKYTLKVTPCHFTVIVIILYSCILLRCVDELRFIQSFFYV